ncbi:hypothetical protein QLX08_003041 [Tetragonisca angustula]|uniref:Uncharacterized protein n=1 Tax=Tetragonisca angustula TaxID=166442 RepID=A0AAW1A973_9HYME
MWLKAAASGKQSETKVTRLWLRPKSCYPDVIRTSFVIFIRRQELKIGKEWNEKNGNSRGSAVGQPVR